MKALLCALAVMASAASAVAGEPAPEFPATVAACRSSMVNARIIGNVSHILVSEGQQVQAGEVLARLDDTLAVAQYEVARIQAESTGSLDNARLQLEQAEHEYKTYSDLKASTRALDLVRLERNVKIAQAQVNQVRQALAQLAAVAALRKAELDFYVVRAPFAGTVASKVIEVGETTYPQDRPLFRVIDVSRVYCSASVEPSAAVALSAGRRAVVTSELCPGRIFEGVISFVSPAADQGSGGRYFTIKVLVDNADGALKPETRASVAFPPAEAAPASAPRTAASDK